MLQDIAPHTYHVEFTPAEPQPADLLLIYGPQGVLSAADALRLPVRADFPDIAVHFAFRLDDRAVFLAREPVEAPEGWRYVPSVTYRDAEPRETAFACATGESLQRWYAANRFCGRCGALMTENPAERAMTCPVCHKNVYPRINPAVIVAVLDHGRLLMTKYANRPLIRRYALIAGFAEIGETIEETVHREVMEEVGLKDRLTNFPAQLSGGEQQRVALARALVNRPDILLADEPTGNLDPKTSEEIMKLLEQINDRGTSVVVVTHNKDIVNSMRKRVVTMHEGSIISLSLIHI